jgi:hypothetical protein
MMPFLYRSGFCKSTAGSSKETKNHKENDKLRYMMSSHILTFFTSLQLSGLASPPPLAKPAEPPLHKKEEA